MEQHPTYNQASPSPLPVSSEMAFLAQTLKFLRNIFRAQAGRGHDEPELATDIMLMRKTLRVSLLPLLAVSLAAQHTTWTSFADRRGHAMALGPNGAVVMFGGQSMTSGEALRDTVKLAGSQPSWSAEQDGIEPRTEHAMTAAVVSGQPRYVVFGGLNNGGTPTNTTWRYDGSAWGDPVSAPAPSARSRHTMVTHLGTQMIYMFGG
ncbi:MAG: hypothetical protein JNK49_17495, partial [Planctomycetes bacterium]|nr:hypothetical protein [Planctomycetota bacterium]